MRKSGLVLMVILFLATVLFQVGVDKKPVGGGDGDIFPTATSLLDFLGGIRQYVAYTLYIKTDKLHHAYYGSLSSEVELVPYFMLISSLDPHYIDAYYIGSELIFEQGRVEEAIDFNLRGIRANPESADLYASLADLCLEEKDYEGAAEAFEKALEYEPEIVDRSLLLMGLSASYHAMGDNVKAKQVLVDLALSDEIRKFRRDLEGWQVKIIVRNINDLWNSIVGNEGGGGEGTRGS